VVVVVVAHVPPAQVALSQSVALWQTAVLPIEQVPPVHEPLSQFAALWQAAAFVEQLPSAEPAPEPHATPPSQSELT